jgi:predicted transcriptional regulator
MDIQAVDRIFDVLKNGKQHTLDEIVQETGIKEPKARIIIAILKKYEFITMDKKGKIKLTPSTRRFLDKLDKTNGSAPFYEEITA